MVIDKAIDVGIITVIPTEIDALFQVLNLDRQNVVETGSPYTYWKTEFYSHLSQRSISVVVTFLTRDAGNTEAGICTSYFLQDWYPRLMCLVGIAAGIKGKVHIGDVVVPNRIHDRTGKVFKSGTLLTRGFSTYRIDLIERMVKIRPISNNEFKLRYMQEIGEVLDQIKTKAEVMGLSPQEFPNEFSIYDGSLSSDNILIRDSAYFDGLVTETDEKCRGADMESAGFVRACQVEDVGFPWLIFRGISDFGDEQKSDDFQSLAAWNASIALKLYLEKTINFNNLSPNPRGKRPSDSLELNLIGQVRDAFQQHRWHEVCRYGEVLSRALWLSGQYEFRIEVGKLVEQAASFIDENRIRVKALIDDLGWTSFVIGDHFKAIRYIKDGLRIADDISDYYFLAKGNRHLASIARRSGNLQEAEHLLNKAQNYAQEIKDDSDRQEIENSLLISTGKLFLEKKQYNDALKLLLEGLDQFRIYGDVTREVKVYSILGRIHLKLNNLDEAVRSFQIGREKAFTTGRYDEIAENTRYLLLVLDDKYIAEKIRMAQEVLDFAKSKGLLVEAKAWRDECKKLQEKA